MQTEIKWKAYEYDYQPKSNEWFISVWILAGAVAYASYLFSNFLFGVLILLFAFLGSVLASRRPKLLNLSLDDKKIKINEEIIELENLQSFFIRENRLLLKQKQKTKPLAIIPLSDEVDKEEMREYLLIKLEEEELSESIFYFLLEKIGF